MNGAPGIVGMRTEGEGWRLAEVVRPTHVAMGLRHEWGTGGIGR